MVAEAVRWQAAAGANQRRTTAEREEFDREYESVAAELTRWKVRCETAEAAAVAGEMATAAAQRREKEAAAVQVRCEAAEARNQQAASLAAAAAAEAMVELADEAAAKQKEALEAFEAAVAEATRWQTRFEAAEGVGPACEFQGPFPDSC